MQYHSCSQIERFSLSAVELITNNNALRICCEISDEIQGVSLDKNAEEILERIIKLREDLISLGKQFENNNQISKKLKGCINCPQFRVGDYYEKDYISYINLSMYPAPCQCKCIYCNFHNDNKFMRIDEKHIKYYNRLFETLELMINDGLISSDSEWQISSGEITIHPFKKRILDLVRDYKVTFYTNCFIFDKDIADILQKNSSAKINLSIDAGTGNSWKKVKGYNNFNKMLENLQMYSSKSLPSQITLKYIILPDINDSIEDFDGIVDIMKRLKTKHLIISRDLNSKHKEKDLLKANILAEILKENGLGYELTLY